MDQEAFFQTDPNDQHVDLGAAPTSGEQYLKQVMRSRDLYCPDIVRVEPKPFAASSSKTKQTEGNSSENDANNSFHAPRWWCDKQCADFSELREKFRRQKTSKSHGQLTHHSPVVSDDDLPELGDEQGWKNFLFSTCAVDLSKFDFLTNIDGSYSGTPPLFSILASMSQPHIIDAFEFCVEWFCEEEEEDETEKEGNVNSPTKPIVCQQLTQWIFALMCALEKPLDPSICSALRRLAQHSVHLLKKCACQSVEVKISEKDRHILEWFVCIAALYFDQKDLLIC